MIKYHGTPLTPMSLFYDMEEAGANFLLSFANQQDVKRIKNTSNKFILDNGAFTTWQQIKKGKRKDIDWLKHWDKYYQWVQSFSNRDFCFIPDVIDGTEEENDALLKDNPFNDGVPIWHIAESFDRLERLASDYDYIAFGSSGEFSKLGTFEWHKRMNEAMKKICNKDGLPLVKIHMLRCLDPRLFTMYPFASGDSTNVAQNSCYRPWWKIFQNIEKYNSPKRYVFREYKQNIQLSLF